MRAGKDFFVELAEDRPMVLSKMQLENNIKVIFVVLLGECHCTRVTWTQRWL